MFPIRLDQVRFAPGGRAVLDGVSLTIGGDGITAVLGPNGAGKSVLLRTLAGLQAIDSGRLDWGGNATPHGEVAMVFQQPMILRASVRANVALGLVPLALSKAQKAARVAGVLARVGLADRAEDSARLLSGGERQRLALARAWAIAPRLLLLDEPTANLDPSATEAVERIIREIRTDGARVLLTTHNLAQATRLADDIIFVAAGRIEEQAPAARFFARPRSAPARRFIQGELPWRVNFDD